MIPQDSSTANNREWVTKLGITFHRYRALARRRWWILLLMISLGVFYQAYVIFSHPVQYESQGSLVLGEKLNIPASSQFVQQDLDFEGTELTILQSPEVYSRAKQRVALEAPNLSGNVVITAEVAPRTSVFEVTGIGDKPEYTQKFVDAVLNEYMSFKRDQRSVRANESISRMNEQLESLRKERDQKQAELDAFVKKNNMAFWDDQSKTDAKYLSDLKTQEANAANELLRLQTLTNDQLLSTPMHTAVTNQTSASDNSAPGDAPVGNDLATLYLQKRQELAQAEGEYAQRSKIWKPEHPRLIAIKQHIEDIERQIQTIKSQNVDANNARIATLKASMTSLQQSIKQWEDKANEASGKDEEFKRLTASLASSKELYEKILLSIGSADLGNKVDEQMLQKFSSASDPVKVPVGVVNHLLTGIFMGLLLGFGILVVMDRADDRFTSTTEVAQQFSETILGQIPNVSDTRTGQGLPLLQKEDTRYMYAEAFRSLRSSLVFLPNQGELKMLLVTSAIPGEGKSTVCSNLSITMAQAGARVLVVDADLRRGDLSELFSVDGKIGLSSVLRGELPWREAIQKTDYETLSLLTCGPVTNQSGELLFQPIMAKLLKEFREEFDLVIFNTSPILATDDTPTLAPQFDGAVMVMRSEFTSARLVRNSLNALYQRQVNVLGIVLNCLDSKMPDYHYYRYPKYYVTTT
jgi:capsular exopolysaccharide synthesis family protein